MFKAMFYKNSRPFTANILEFIHTHRSQHFLSGFVKKIARPIRVLPS